MTERDKLKERLTDLQIEIQIARQGIIELAGSTSEHVFQKGLMHLNREYNAVITEIVFLDIESNQCK